MNLKVQYFLALALLLAIGCRKESIETNTNTTIDPPTQIETAFISGVVVHNGQSVVGAAIDVYEGETLKGSIVTDQNGQFNTTGLSLKIGAAITFLAKKDALATTPKRIVAATPEMTGITINMPQSGLSFFAPAMYSSPGSANWVTLSGYITGPDGTPVPNVLVGLLYGVNPNSSGFEANGSWSIYTDDNGYFEGLMPKDSLIHLFALQSNFGSAHYRCEGDFLNSPDLFPNLWPLESLGRFSENTVLETINNAYVPISTAEITGNAADCSGNPLTDFTIEISAALPNGTFSTPVSLMNGAQFYYSFDLCNGPVPTLSLRATDNITGKKSALKTFTNVNGPIDFGTLLTCQ